MRQKESKTMLGDLTLPVTDTEHNALDALAEIMVASPLQGQRRVTEYLASLRTGQWLESAAQLKGNLILLLEALGSIQGDTREELLHDAAKFRGSRRAAELAAYWAITSADERVPSGSAQLNEASPGGESGRAIQHPTE